MQANPLLTELKTLLNRWIRWLRVRRAVAWATHGLLFGLALSLALALAGLLQGVILQAEFSALITISSAVWALIGGLAGYFRPVRALPAARFFDLTFDLKERTSTALEQASMPTTGKMTVEISDRQLTDAVHAARPVRPQSLLPIHVPWQEMVLAALLVIGAVFAAWQGEAWFRAALEKRIVRQAIQEEAARVEAIRAEIEANPALTLEQREALTRPLDQALERLEQAETAEQGVSALTAAQEELRALSDPEAQAQAQALREVGRNLSEDTSSPLASAGQALSEGDILQAAQELGRVDPETLSEEQLEELAGQLEETAAALETTNPDMSERLRQAAQAARSGDSQAAQQALQEAASSLSQSGQEIIQSEVAGQAANQMGEGQQRVIEAGRGQATAQQGQGDQPGAGDQTGDGQNSQPSRSTGQGSSQGSGAGRGEGGGETGAGSEVGDGQIEQDNAPGDGGERPYEQIFVPERLGGEGGPDVSLPGSGLPGDEVTGSGDTPEGSPGNSQVPYVEVFPQYEDAAYQALDQYNYPPFLRSLVKKYFSGLEP